MLECYIQDSGNTKTNKAYFCLSLFLVVYIILINNISNSTLSLIAILLCFPFITKPMYIVPPLMVASLLGEYFVAFKGIGTGRFMTIVFILGSILMIIKRDKKINKAALIAFCIINSFNFISGYFSISGELMSSVKMLLNTSAAFFLFHYKEVNVEELIRLLSGCLVILVLFLAYMVYAGNAESLNGRLVLDEAVNANQVGMALAQITAFFSAVTMISWKKKSKVFFTVLVVISFILLVLTGSRSAMVGLLMGVGFTVFFFMLQKGKISNILFGSILISLAAVLMYFWFSKIDLPVLHRFSISDVLASGGTGRVKIWEVLIRYVIPEHLWFGVGFGGYNVPMAVLPYLGYPRGTHNIVLTIIAQTGIIGSLLYFWFFIKTEKKFLSTAKKNSYMIIPTMMTLTAFANGIGEEIFTDRFLWLGIGLGYLILNKNTKKNMKTTKGVEELCK